jgi:MYXO-CTERM domain-containing protein
VFLLTLKCSNYAQTCMLVLVSLTASAAVITFSGSDPGVAPGGARPNSDTARANFLAAAGLTTLINFESLPTGSPATILNLGSGVTYTPTNPDGFSGVFSTDSTTLGYNTTPLGIQHLRYSSGSPSLDATFSFSTPIFAFGAYFTGMGNSGPAASVLFNDGTSQSFTLTAQVDGGVQFFGFTDVGNSISAVTLRGNTTDVFGIDDLSFAAVSAVSPVPEPSTWSTLVLPAIALAGLALRRRASVLGK